jgi:multimeric flavodoxin WrbA
MNLLAVIGSPRKKGSISRLAENILKGAEENGWQTELINLYDYEIKPCQGCWSCVYSGKCFIDDDFQEIFTKLKNADVIILGSPVYWANVSGVMKNFFDRHTGYAMFLPKEAQKVHTFSFWKKIKTAVKFLRTFGPKFPSFANKRYILITASTIPFKHLMGEVSLTVKAMKKYVKKINGKIIKKIQYSDTLFRFRRKKDENLMKKAYKIGKTLRFRKHERNNTEH